MNVAKKVFGILMLVLLASALGACLAYFDMRPYVDSNRALILEQVHRIDALNARLEKLATENSNLSDRLTITEGYYDARMDKVEAEKNALTLRLSEAEKTLVDTINATGNADAALNQKIIAGEQRLPMTIDDLIRQYDLSKNDHISGIFGKIYDYVDDTNAGRATLIDWDKLLEHDVVSIQDAKRINGDESCADDVACRWQAPVLHEGITLLISDTTKVFLPALPGDIISMELSSDGADIELVVENPSLDTVESYLINFKNPVLTKKN